MDASHQLLLGLDPAVQHRATLAQCVAALQASRSAGRLPRTLWIVPTPRAQKQWSRHLLAELQSVCLAPPLLTFDRFAEQILRAGGHPATQISSTVRRLLLRRITQRLHREQQLKHFAGAAQTSGFLDVVSSFIAEVKREEVWPEDFLSACGKSSRVTQRDRELGLIYQQYQQQLLANHWYDAEGRYWLARTWLADGHCPAWSAWDWIGVSGFADFTRTQYEILEQLSQHCPSLVITLPGNPAGEREELFAKSQVATQTLQRHIPQLRTRLLPASERGQPARQTLCRSLFSNPRSITPAEDCTGLEAVACLGTESETTEVALRIKRLLARGVPPQHITIGMRQVNEYGRRCEAELTAAGLPVWCEVGQPLRESGVIKFLLAVLQNELEDWKFDRLMTVLGSSALQPGNYAGEWVKDVRQTDRVLRGLRLSQGRRDILPAVERASTRFQPVATAVDVDDTDVPQERPLNAEQYQAALRCLTWFQRVTEPFSRSQTLGEWIAVLDQLLTVCGVVGPSVQEDPGRLRRTQHWESWQRRLRDAALAEAQSLSDVPRWELAALLPELRDYLAEERLEPLPEPAGAIRILSLEQIRHLEVPYLFLVHLTEDSFPRRHRDDCLFTETERRHFVELGVPLRHALRHQQEELLFFATLMLSATECVTLTYSAVDGRGQPQFSSPYVSAIQSLWSPGAFRVQAAGQLDPVPAAERSVSTTDARLLSMQAALRGESGWFRCLAEQAETRSTARNLLSAVEMAHARFETSGFTKYEGRLEHPGHLVALSQRFHQQRQFSATELEAYATCPFRFWLEHVLDIEPVPNVESGTDHLRRGVVVHDVLSRLVDHFHQDHLIAELGQRFTDLVTTQLQRQPTQSDLERALLRIEEQLLTEWSGAYAEQFQEYVAQISEHWDTATHWQTAPEVPFGTVPHLAPEVAHPPLKIGREDQPVLLRGRIDRIDIGRVSGQPVFTIIDYKTGRRPDAKETDQQAGRRLQLVLYAVAARRLGLVPADASPYQLGYWCLKETGFRSGLPGRNAAKFQAIDAATWTALEQIVDETIPQLVAGLRGGEFVVENADDNCTGHCAFHTVCRVNQIRPLVESRVKLRRTYSNDQSDTSKASASQPISPERSAPPKTPRSRSPRKSSEDPT